MSNLGIENITKEYTPLPYKNHLQQVTLGIEQARGIPNQYYTDQICFNIEKEIIFNKNWAAIGFAKDIPQLGSVKPITFFNNPYFLIRSKEDNKIRVFQNVCIHRGMKLIEKEAILKGAIRCPYHSWCYKQTGENCATPHIGGPGLNFHKDVPKEELNLIEVRSHVWRDIIFINLDGRAKNFEEINKPLIERWKEFNQPMFSDSQESSFNLDLNGNWKLAVENYLEAYHLPWVHPGLNSYSKLEDHENIVKYGHYSGQISYKYNPIYSTGKAFNNFKNLNPSWDSKGEYIVLFPNLILGVQRDHIFNQIIEPLAPNKIRENVEIYYSDEKMLGNEYKATRIENAKLWKTVFEEDIFVVEGMQQGRLSEGFNGGRFSPVMDVPTHVFHDWYARKLLSG